MIKVITWNVNSLPIRLNHLNLLLKKEKPHIVLLQETRSNQNFNIPGYYNYFNNFGGRNGVSILSIWPGKIVEQDQEGRLIIIETEIGYISSVYVPNGFSISSPVEKKISFLKRIQTLPYKNIIIGGDWNVTYRSTECSVKLPYTEIEIKEFQRVEEAFNFNEILYQREKFLTWWDYRINSFNRNLGMGIDKIFIRNFQEVKKMYVLKEYRGLERPSDHAPVEIIVK